MIEQPDFAPSALGASPTARAAVLSRSVAALPVNEAERFDPTAPEFAAVKRFFEVWMADAEFRQALLRDGGRSAAAARGITVDPDDLRYLWDGDYRRDVEHSGRDIDELSREAPRPTKLLFAWFKFGHRIRDRIRAESRPADPRYAAWRTRQMARASSAFRAAYDHFTPHILFAVELSKGCSVGCWFCGISAPKLDGHFLHTPANKSLFLDVLASLRDFTGAKAGGWGFLYWATDPFDNPDFEKFSSDFVQVFGRFPVMTTAQPLRDLPRTRAFLRLAAAHDRAKVRFSLTTIRMMREVHRQFSPQELGQVDLIPINKGSLLRPAATGKARERYLRDGSAEFARSQMADTSISCVSGFLISMVERTVKLITPCPSCEKWPLGYCIYEQRSFANGDELHNAIESMIARHMPLVVPADKVLRFRSDLAYRGTDDGFVLDARYGRQTVSENPLLRDLGDAIAGANRTCPEIARAFAGAYGLDQDISLGWIDRLFAMGVLDEEPLEGVSP